MKKVAIMQPYAFPYLGYFQLVEKVEHFVFLDNVNYFKKGFINRNNLYGKSGWQSFTLSISAASQNKLISELRYVDNKSKFFKSIEYLYTQTSRYAEIKSMIEKVLCSDDQTVSKVNANSIEAICRYLGIKTNFSFASNIINDTELSAQARIIQICKELDADFYLNPKNGIFLYSQDEFLKNGLNLCAFEAEPLQKIVDTSNSPEKNASILHFLFNFDKTQISSWLALGDIEITGNQKPPKPKRKLNSKTEI